MEELINSMGCNTSNGNTHIFLKSDPYKHKVLKYFLNFKDEKVYFVGTAKNKTIFKNTEDINKIENYFKN